MTETRLNPVTTDVLVVGAGGAGMYAALAAARAGASVLLLDKNMVGRGGATIMAQMTVAVALGSEEEDHWSLHFADTLRSGKGLSNQELSLTFCQEGPERILEMDDWGVGWARENGRIRQVVAPGHSRKRCVYVDILNTGPSVARTLQGRIFKEPEIHRLSNVVVTELVVSGGRCIGAVGVNLASGQAVAVHAKAVVLAAGGLTQLYSRNSASSSMTGDAYALALRTGAELVDMEFVQFFPIAHLAPRLVGMDPIMWDPFRYKLGGRLLNGSMEEFMHRYGSEDAGRYVGTRDLVSQAILKEVEAGRGSPHGGAYLDFQHIPEEQLRSAFGPVIVKLQKNGIDLTRMPVEVAPMAHFHMGGLRCNCQMETSVPGLYGAGEAVGGAHGANRLSGNAITEAFVFGERAGRFAARYAAATADVTWDETAAANARVGSAPTPSARRGPGETSPGQVMEELKALMSAEVGPTRTEEGLKRALQRVRELRSEVLPTLRLCGDQAFNLDVLDWLDLRNMLDTAEVIAMAALERRESRGAHVRVDYPETDEGSTANLVARRSGGELKLAWAPVATVDAGVGA